MRKVQGQYGVLLTPFDKTGAVDQDKLSAICKYTMNSKVQGIVVAGTTSEFPCMTMEDNMEILKTVVGLNANRKHIVFSACAPSIHQTVQLIKGGEALGITEFLVCPPYYMPVIDPADIVCFYKEILTRTNANIILYNIPMCTQPITIPLFKKLATENRIIGIKDSTGNFKSLVNYLNITKERSDFSVLTGSDEVLQYALLAGCHGSMSALGCVLPEAGQYIYENYLRNHKNADQLQKLVAETVAKAESMVFPDGYKLLLKAAGVDPGALMQPNHFSPERVTQLQTDLEKLYFDIKKIMGGFSCENN